MAWVERVKSAAAVARTEVTGRLDQWQARAVLPRPVNDSDLFLVEFPRSGITWLSFLIANAMLVLGGDPRRATFLNIQDFVPDIHVRARLPGSPLGHVGYRVIKSHAPYTPCYKKLFYLVRDPRHVMASYYAFLTGLGGFSGSIEALVEHRRYGIDAWCAHVEGWLTRVAPGISMAIIRYEDLLADPAAELGHCLAELGWPVGEGQMAEIVACSDLGAMREAEARYNSRHPVLGSFDFVRPGASGGARVALPSALERRIVERAAPLLQRLGYPA